MAHLTNFIKNGYFYMLHYNVKAQTKKEIGYDPYPLIYCIKPDERNINNFWGLSFHQMTKNIQIYIYKMFIKKYNLDIEPKKRQIISDEELLSLYSKFTDYVRCYNRKKILKSYQVYFNEIPLLLYFNDTELKLYSHLTQETEFALKPGNKGF